MPTRREVFDYFGLGLMAIGLDQVAAVRQAGLSRVVQALEVTRRAEVSDPAALEDLDTVVEHYKRSFRSTPRWNCIAKFLVSVFILVRCSTVCVQRITAPTW